MALKCGTTANGCSGKSGMYRIDYIIPDPSYVRYRYPNEAWQEVKKSGFDLNFEFVEVSNPGQASGVRYRISVYCKGEVYTIRSGTNNDLYGGFLYPHYGLPWTTAQFTGPITSVILTGGDVRRAGDYGGWSRVIVQITDATGTRTFTTRHFSQPNAQGVVVGLASSQYFKDPIPPPNYENLGLTFTRVDGQSEEKKCRFLIKDVYNNVIFERTENICPEAVKFPSKYGNDKGSFKITNRDLNKPLAIANVVINGIQSTQIKLGNTVIKTLSSPAGSTLSPRVCWDCSEGDKCPSGTCEVKCKNHTCCVDKNGQIVKTISK